MSATWIVEQHEKLLQLYMFCLTNGQLFVKARQRQAGHVTHSDNWDRHLRQYTRKCLRECKESWQWQNNENYQTCPLNLKLMC